MEGFNDKGIEREGVERDSSRGRPDEIGGTSGMVTSRERTGLVCQRNLMWQRVFNY
jgi:hypothetical protein